MRIIAKEYTTNKRMAWYEILYLEDKEKLLKYFKLKSDMI